MELKPQPKSLEMRRVKAHDFYPTSWRLVTNVVPRQTRGWGAKYR